MYPRTNLEIVLCVIFLCMRALHSSKPQPLIKGHHVVLSHAEYLDTKKYVLLRWGFNKTDIVFQLSAPTSGWMGIGLSPKSNMAGSDLVVMWMNEGKVVLKDMYGVRNGLPMLDHSQNYELVHGRQTDGKFVVNFSRKLLTCDDNDFSIVEGNIRVIYAYNLSPPQNPKFLDHIDIHSPDKVGAKSIRLISQKQEPMDFENQEDILTMDIVHDNVTIPPKRTYYHCAIRKLNIGNRTHILRAEPVIQHGNHKLVHHMVVYICSDIFDPRTIDLKGSGNECKAMEQFRNCDTQVFTWAIGGRAFSYPEGVGLPLGEVGKDIYIKLETHYDNPMLAVGQKDSSGMRLFYTPTLIRIDAGTLIVGEVVQNNVGQFIPPRVHRWTKLHQCHKECSESSFADRNVDSVKVFAVFFHTHLYGVGLRLHHYRNGNELRMISKDDYYDFNYQDYNHLQREVEFKKGDELELECVYDTSTLDIPVYTGAGTEEEMCLAYIQYYPEIDLDICTSYSDLTVVSDALNIDVNPQNYTTWWPEFNQTLHSTRFDVKKLNDKINNGDFMQKCKRDDKLVLMPKSKKIYEGYIDEDKTCMKHNAAVKISLQIGLLLLVVASTLCFIF